jgi:hypothetical protein
VVIGGSFILWERGGTILAPNQAAASFAAATRSLRSRKAAAARSRKMDLRRGLPAFLSALSEEIGMLVTATILVCAACVKAYQIWMRSKREGDADMVVPPSVGMHGALVEPRR